MMRVSGSQNIPVSLVGLKPQMVLALVIVEKIYDRYGVDLVITSGCEGKHKTGSLHPLGLAVDVRKRDFASTLVVEAVVEEMQVKLNGRAGNQYGEYDITISPFNIHMEFDPK